MRARARALFVAAVLAATPAAPETVAIVGARVLTMGPAGNLEHATVVVRGGLVVGVGAGLALPEGARVIDGAGMVLTPGMSATVTPLATNDTIGSGDGGVGTANASVSAAFDPAYDINPDSPQIGEARIEGVTYAVVTPTTVAGHSASARNDRQIFAGQAVAIDLAAAGDVVLKRNLAVVLEGGAIGAGNASGGQGAVYALLKESLSEARLYARNRAAFREGRNPSFLWSLMDLAALIPVAEGREPLMVEVNRASEIRDMVGFAKSEGIKLIISGGAEAWMDADMLAAAHVPVVLDAEDNEPASFEVLNATYENAALLQRAGVLIAFKPSVARIVYLIRTPRFLAGRTVRYGLSQHDALAAITVNPAKIFGLADRLGSIAPGKRADLVLWSGDPLETTTVARAVIIRGEVQPLDARNRQLRDRYIGAVKALPSAAP
jgi:imidazolonepropionase-like amidohydrolase